MKRWQKLLDESYRSLSDLKEPLGISDERYAELAPFEENYPILVTPYYLRLMNRLDADDPIKKMVVPDLSVPATIDAEAGKNTESVIQGGQHKYQKSVLIISNNQALGYARHCYRRDFARLDEDEASLRIPKLAEYIGDHPEIDNISVSGGDAFLNTNERIGEYLKAFAFLPNVDYIRFTTSVPATFPQRITEDDGELLALLARYAKAKAIIVVTQFNHPREITEEAYTAIRLLREAGCTVRNEGVLLRGVNDDAKTLRELMTGLVSIGVVPYYLYQCRVPTGFEDHLQVPLAEGIRIVGEAKAQMSGMANSFRYIMSHRLGKVQMIGFIDDGRAAFKVHSARDEKYQGRIFFEQLADDQVWLD